MGDSIKRSLQRMQFVAAEPVFLAWLVVSGAGFYGANNAGEAHQQPATAFPGIKVRKVEYRPPNLSTAVLSGEELRHTDRQHLPPVSYEIDSAGFTEPLWKAPVGGFPMERGTILVNQVAVEPHSISPRLMLHSLPEPKIDFLDNGVQGEAGLGLSTRSTVLDMQAGQLPSARSGHERAGLADVRPVSGDSLPLPALGRPLEPEKEAASLVPQAALPTLGPGKTVPGNGIPQATVAFVMEEEAQPLTMSKKNSALQHILAAKVDFAIAEIPSGLVSVYGADISQGTENTVLPASQTAKMVTAVPEADSSATRRSLAVIAETSAASPAKLAIANGNAQTVAPKEMPAPLGLSTDPVVRTVPRQRQWHRFEVVI